MVGWLVSPSRSSQKVGKHAFPPLPTRPRLELAVYPALLSFDRTCKWETVFCCMLQNSINCYLSWLVCRSLTICFFSVVQCMVFCVCISCCVFDCLSLLVIQSLSLFSHMHATLQPASSVGPFVPWSICPQIRQTFFFSCRHAIL